MTTDLTDDFELGEEEFDWDVFLPDPDDAEIAAEAAALDDEADLDLDDSDLDWEAALHEDSDREPGTDGSARAGAAFDRIVDTVRGSFDEPASETELEHETQLAPEVELALANELEPEAEAALEPGAAESEPKAELESEAELEAEVESEPDAGLALALALALATELEPEEDPEDDTNLLTASKLALAAELGPEENHATEAGLEPEEDLGADTNLITAWKLAIAAEMGWEVEHLATEAGLEPETDPNVEPVADPPAEPNAVTVAMAAVAAAAAAAPEPIVSLEPESELVEVSEWPWDDDGQSATPRGPSHARARKGGERQPRSRVFTTTVVLACLLAGAVAAAAVVHSMHHPAATTQPPAHSTSHISSTAGATRFQTATDAVDSATTAARVGLTSLSSFPTPTNVATEINPYISSLQLYGAFLQGRSVPEPARPLAARAEAQVRQDLKLLGTIDGLPPVQLGAYLEQFETNATQLHTTLSALEQSLRTPTS